MKTVLYEKLTLALDENLNWLYVIGCEKDAVEVVIPKTIDGAWVCEISEHAFDGCKSLKSVIFPEYDEYDYIHGELLKEIGWYAFSGCVSLRKVKLPQTVHTIDRGAFYGCKNLKSIEFAPNVFVGAFAFYGCESLTKIPDLYRISEGAFSGCKSLKKLPICNVTEEICEDGFEHCESVEEVTIPKSLTRIESEAFSNCYNLKRVYFERQDGWVYYCNYRQAEFPLNVSDPERNAKNLRTLDFDDGVLAWYIKKENN